MKCFFLIFLINFVFISIQAQKKNCYCKYYNVSEETLEDKITCITLPNENIKLPKGEIYNQLSSGDIILNNGEKITDRAIRYDGVLDQLILPSADDRVKIAVEKSTLKGFDIRMFNSNKILHFNGVLQKSYLIRYSLGVAHRINTLNENLKKIVFY